MRIRFWGTRGSLAKPGPSTIRYGGNTSCVEVRAADGTLIILDCGTGAHDLGRSLVASGERPIRGHLLLTHTHWDHIQGFPFFAPLFIQGNEFDVYAAQGLGQRLEDTLAGQMEYTYFPVTLGQLGATIRYHELSEGTFDLGAVQVTARYLNHPGLALGYRLEAGGVAMVYATDHEPHSRHHPEVAGPAQVLPVHREDQRHVEFLAGADLVIHDAQYTLEEYPSKLTWGHSPAELAVDFALAAGVKRLALFHHDPLRDDAALDQLVESCRRRRRRPRRLCCRRGPDDRASGAGGRCATRCAATGNRYS
jgi:phosphoribosyl 1,2-cyclic phosphodiesterase